jgi:hypothetical protein
MRHQEAKAQVQLKIKDALSEKGCRRRPALGLGHFEISNRLHVSMISPSSRYC